MASFYENQFCSEKEIRGKIYKTLSNSTLKEYNKSVENK